MSLTEDEKDGLSPEEIEALESEDEKDDSPDEDKPEGKDETDDTGEGPGDDSTKDKPDDKPDDTDKKAEPDDKPEDDKDKPAGEDDKTEEKPDTKATTERLASMPDPAMYAMLPPVDKDQIDAARKAAEEAKKKYEDGDLSVDEYTEARDKLKELEIEQRLVERQNVQNARMAWEAEQGRFLRDNPLYRGSQAMFDLLAANVNAIIDEIRAGKTKDMSNDALLAEGRKRAEAAMDPDALELLRGKHDPSKKEAVSAAAKAKAAAEAEAKAEADKKKAIADAKKAAGDPKKAGKTLRDIPPADDTTGEGKWDWLENLSGAAYEAALAKLSDAEAEEYLNAR